MDGGKKLALEPVSGGSEFGGFFGNEDSYTQMTSLVLGMFGDKKAGVGSGG